MQKVKKGIPKKLIKGIPLTIRPDHTIRLKATTEPLTVHTGLSLFYAMAQTLNIPGNLDKHVKVKQRDSGYPESEHIFALAANAFADETDELLHLSANRQALRCAPAIPIRGQRP